MSDGADLGMNAEEALNVVLGGEESPEGRVRSTGEMAARIRATTEPSGYEGTADYAAKLILEWLEADPTRAQGPTENVYRLGPNGEWTGEVTEHGWYDRMKEDGIPMSDLELTGFMWGWAVNAARSIVELPPVPNPALFAVRREE